MMAMKALKKELRDSKALVFFDLEGTGESHEMIEIGAYLAEIGEECALGKIKGPFKRYVKAKNPIGYHVTKITGITEKKLVEEGRPFAEVVTDFRHFVGRYWESARFVAFGPHDLRIINQSAFHSPENLNLAYLRNWTRRFWDFQAFLQRFITDERNNPLSLVHYVEKFNLAFEGENHDAASDAKNLMAVYSAFLANKETIVYEEYGKTILRNRKLPEPALRVLRNLSEGQTVTGEDYQKAIRESLE